MIRFIIPYPKNKSKWNKEYGMNAIYSGKHWTRRKKDSEFWHWLVISELKKQGVERKIINAPVRIIFYHNTRMDIDNHSYIEKMIVDALKGYVIVDDTKRYYTERTSRFHGLDCIAVEIYREE